MEGVVDFHLRKLYSRVGGVDMCVTEFIRINDQVLPKRVFLNRCPELSYAHENLNDHELLPIRVQLLGSNPSMLAANASKAAELGAIGIDLNFGCPAKTVNRNKGGACLLDETGLIYDIVESVRSSVPASIPVTAKIRLGYNDRSTYLQNAQAIESAGASEIFVHARSKADGYNPPAYWHMIGDIHSTLSIPVIANGEIWTVDDFIRCKKESGCDDFMLGRGLLANPGLAKEIRGIYNAQTSKEQQSVSDKLTWSDITPLLHELLISTSEAYPPKFMGNRVKQWLHYLRMHFDEAEVLFHQVKRLKEFAPIESLILQSSDLAS